MIRYLCCCVCFSGLMFQQPYSSNIILLWDRLIGFWLIPISSIFPFRIKWEPLIMILLNYVIDKHLGFNVRIKYVCSISIIYMLKLDVFQLSCLIQLDSLCFTHCEFFVLCLCSWIWRKEWWTAYMQNVSD